MFKKHKWRIQKDTGKFAYFECEKCGDRAIIQKFYSGYQPIDKTWVSGRKPKFFCSH